MLRLMSVFTRSRNAHVLRGLRKLLGAMRVGANGNENFFGTTSNLSLYRPVAARSTRRCGDATAAAAGNSAQKACNSFDARTLLLSDWTTTSLKLSVQSGADTIALNACLMDSAQALSSYIGRMTEAFEASPPSAHQKLFAEMNCDDNEDKWRELLKEIVKPGSQFWGILLRNVSSADDLRLHETLLTEAEKAVDSRQKLKLAPVIETPEAFFSVKDIASASRRNVALVAATGNLDMVSRDTVQIFKVNTVVAAHGEGLVSLAGWLDGDEDVVRLRTSCEQDKITGFHGKVIAGRPDLVSMVNYVHTIDGLHAARARDILGMEKPGTVKQGAAVETKKPRVFRGLPHLKLASGQMLRFGLQQEKVSESVNKLVGQLSAEDIPQMLDAKYIKHGFNQNLKVGDVIRCPYEITADETWITLWQMIIFNPRTMETSARLRRRLDTTRPVLQYSLCFLLALSLAVSRLSEHARFHLGTYDGCLVRPLCTGDTIRAFFRIDNIEATKQKFTVIDTTHVLVNQNDELAFSVRKKTMFPEMKFESVQPAEITPPPESLLRRRILNSSLEKLLQWQSEDQPCLKPGDVFIHQLVRSIQYSDVIYFCNLARITNDFHLNFHKFKREELVVPGPLVMFSAISNSLPDFGEPLFHYIDVCTHINKFNPEDTVGTISYIVDVKPIPEHHALEEVTIKQLGIKNVDMSLLLSEKVPQSLFDVNCIKTADYERICQNWCPILMRRICLQLVRRFIRVKPTHIHLVQEKLFAREREACQENRWFGDPVAEQ